MSSFVGFVPGENPKIVGLVLIEEPQGKYYAGEIAAPVFSRVVSQALGILRVAPEEQRLPARRSLPPRAPFPRGSRSRLCPRERRAGRADRLGPDRRPSGRDPRRPGSLGAAGARAASRGVVSPPASKAPDSSSRRTRRPARTCSRDRRDPLALGRRRGGLPIRPRARGDVHRDTRAVRLMELLSALPGADRVSPAGADPEIRRVVHDSRRVEPGRPLRRDPRREGRTAGPRAGGDRAAAPPRSSRSRAAPGGVARAVGARARRRAGRSVCSRRGWPAIRPRSSFSPA